MEKYSYLTISSHSKGFYREKGSKFISLAFPVESESEIKLRIEEIKKQYHDARHHCFAWILGSDKSRYRAFDDGEPNHSAGDPILGQLKSKNLTNALVIVVRYFGGTKLGISGLINAYRSAARDALEKANVIEKENLNPLIIRFDYSYTQEVMRLVNEFGLPLLTQEFVANCTIRTELRARLKERFLEKAKLLRQLGNQIEIEFLNEN